MPKWDQTTNRVIGNRDIRLCCCTVMSGQDADESETRKISEGVVTVIKNVQEKTSGVGATIVNIAGMGVVDRSADAARDAAISVIKKRVPGVTRRVVRAMHFTLPIGLLVMIAGAILANTDTDRNYYYAGLPLGAYLAYSPVESETSSIKKEAEAAAERESSLAKNLCTIQ